MLLEGIRAGLWVNWELGPLKGLTLTIPTQWALILAAVIAVYIRVTATSLWRVVRYLIHQTQATSVIQDALYHQQQIILRNSTNEVDTTWKHIELLWHWAQHSRSAILRCFPIIFLGLLHIIAFAVAGIFASALIFSSNEAVVRSLNCGSMEDRPAMWMLGASYSDPYDVDAMNILTMSTRRSYQQSYSYADTCYRPEGILDDPMCSQYVVRNIESRVTENSTCPFNQVACKTGGLMLDTGMISSAQLGINVPVSDSVTVRRVTQCVPLNGERYRTDYVREIRAVDQLSNNTWVTYSMGKRNNPEAFWTPAGFQVNTTFVGSKYSQILADSPYSLVAATALADRSQESDFAPIADFHSDVSDVTLIALYSSASYSAAVNDAWFNATNSTANPPFKTPSNYVSFLGCTEQYQFCKAGGACTALAGLYQNGPEPQLDLGLSARQSAVYKVLWNAVSGTRLNQAVTVMGSDMLKAKDYLMGKTSTSSPLPDNQWQQEVSLWHNASIAELQSRVVAYAVPSDIAVRPGLSSLADLQGPTNSAEMSLCNSIKVRTATYTSFSVLHLAIIVIPGLVMILGNLIVVPCCVCITRRRGTGEQRRTQWVENSALHLHRNACQARGIGSWIRVDRHVPIPIPPEQKFSLSAADARQRMDDFKFCEDVGLSKKGPIIITTTEKLDDDFEDVDLEANVPPPPPEPESPGARKDNKWRGLRWERKSYMRR